MKNGIINGIVLEMLSALEEVLRRLEIDYYLVGAIARDIALSVNPAYVPQRATNDVDIAILLSNERQFYLVKSELLATGKFTVHETEIIKLFYRNSVELDLLPFGGIENEGREAKLEQPRLFVIDVPGFLEVFPDAEQYVVDEQITLKVCPLEGIILLKLIANDDQPGRTKDIVDIIHIISVYFELKDREIYENHMDLMDNYDINDPEYLKRISARVIGRKIGHMIANSTTLQCRILQILDRKTTGGYWYEMAEGIKESGRAEF